MIRFFGALIALFLFGCSAPKSVYYFDGSGYPTAVASSSLTTDATKRVDSARTVLLASDNLLTASIGIENYQYTTVRLDTGKVPTDSLRKKGDHRLTKEEYQKAYEEKERLYQERERAYKEKNAAYKQMREVRAANKDKRKDIFTILGAILISIAVVSLLVGFSTSSLGALALIVGIPGFIFSLIGLKSRIWGMSVAFLIIAAVVASMYLALVVVYGYPE